MYKAVIVLLSVWLCIVSAQPRTVSVNFISDAPSGTVNIVGSLMLPSAPPGVRVPAIVLVHGSGPGQENQTVGYILPNFRVSPPKEPSCGITSVPDFGLFVQLSESFAQEGFAVLRYNKRECYKEFPGCTYSMCNLTDPSPPRTCVNLHKLTVNDLAVDAANAVRYLQQQWSQVIDPSAVSLVGHSQGCSTVLYAASLLRESNNKLHGSYKNENNFHSEKYNQEIPTSYGVKSIVQLMGLGLPIDKVITGQVKDLGYSYYAGKIVCTETNGDPQVLQYYDNLATGAEELLQQAETVFAQIHNGTYTDDEEIVYVGTPSSVGYWVTWMKWGDFNEMYDLIQSLSGTKILAVNSPTDVQVKPEYYTPLHAALYANPGSEVAIISDITHMLIPDDLSTNQISPSVIYTVLSFLKQ